MCILILWFSQLLLDAGFGGSFGVFFVVVVVLWCFSLFILKV